MQHESLAIQPENAPSVRAHLIMDAGKLKVSSAADARNEWDPRFNDHVPANLLADMGARVTAKGGLG